VQEGLRLNVFSWLLLAHLVGDWLLQNDWMARGKRQGLFTLAGTVHFAVYTATAVGALWLSGAADGNPIVLLIGAVVIFASHWLLDAAGIADRWVRLCRQSDGESVRIMVDQTLHLLVLAALAVFSQGV